MQPAGESCTHNRKTQISAKPETGNTEREYQAYLDFGFFSGVFLHLINCPNEGEALIRPVSESSWKEWGREMRVD